MIKINRIEKKEKELIFPCYYTNNLDQIILIMQDVITKDSYDDDHEMIEGYRMINLSNLRMPTSEFILSDLKDCIMSEELQPLDDVVLNIDIAE